MRISEGHNSKALPASDGVGWRSLHEQQAQFHAQSKNLYETNEMNSATNTRHPQTKLTSKSGDSSVAEMFKTEGQSPQTATDNILSEGDSSIETYMTCNSSVYLKSPISPNEQVEHVTASPVTINSEATNQNGPLKIESTNHESFEFETTNSKLCSMLSNQNAPNLESADHASLKLKRANETERQLDPVAQSDIEAPNHLSLSDKSNILGTKGDNSEYIKGDNSTYVNISLCSNDSAKVSLSEVCVNNNFRTQRTQMVLPCTNVPPISPHMKADSDVISQNKEDQRTCSNTFQSTSTCDREMANEHHTSVPIGVVVDLNLPRTVPSIYDEEHGFVPYVYNVESTECESKFCHSTPRATEDTNSKHFKQTGEGAKTECNEVDMGLQPMSLYSEELHSPSADGT
ncbi:MAG: hypothetical protein ABW168_01860 [Sedimenticola sp.]